MYAAHRLLRQTVLGLILFLGFSQIGPVRSDIWPNVPLVVKSPYLSVWSNGSLIGYDNSNFWNSYNIVITIHVRFNNTIYTITPRADTSLQTGLKVTPTQSIFNITIGPLILTYNFFTPVEANNLKRLSSPVSYLAVSARSTDNRIYPVQIFVAWWDGWSSGDHNNEPIQWNSQQVGPHFDLYMEQVNQTPLTESGNGPLWGRFHVFTNSLGTTFQIDNIDYLIGNFTTEGRLNDIMDDNFRPHHIDGPGMAFTKDIYAGPLPSPNVFFVMSRVARPGINTTEGPMNQLWEDFFEGDEKEMIQFAFEDAEEALVRCEVLDNQILAAASQEGGQSYSKLVSGALRQAFAAIEFVGTQNRTWAFIKDIGLSVTESGNCQRVDMMYANMLVHLYLNPKILKYLLEPLLVYQESGIITGPYAVSDLGLAYPQCTGGHDRSMGVEQSANMIIMIDAYVKFSNDTAFTRQHYDIIRKWADYLVTNGLFPGGALTSDDFLGAITNSTNLSLKAIVAIAAMADIAQRINDAADYSRYRSVAINYTAQWISLAQDPQQTHIKFSFNDQIGDSWVLLYNLYADILLGTNLIPTDVTIQQELWYLSHAEKYGIPLGDVTKDTKVDWLLFTAAASPSKTVRQAIYDRLALFLNDDNLSFPFRDRFDATDIGVNYLYTARPTVGAVFAPLVGSGLSRLD